jgi:hypothetical protein
MNLEKRKLYVQTVHAHVVTEKVEDRLRSQQQGRRVEDTE